MVIGRSLREMDKCVVTLYSYNTQLLSPSASRRMVSGLLSGVRRPQSLGITINFSKFDPSESPLHYFIR